LNTCLSNDNLKFVSSVSQSDNTVYTYEVIFAIIYKNSVLQAVNDLVTELEQANITCRATITFAESDFKDQLRMLRVRA
jgi:hypothetical protein